MEPGWSVTNRVFQASSSPYENCRDAPKYVTSPLEKATYALNCELSSHFVHGLVACSHASPSKAICVQDMLVVVISER